jgi:hypothetical protein
VLFDQTQDWPFWVKLQRGSYKCDAFHSRLVFLTNDGCILNRPETLQRRVRGIYRLYVRVRKTEAQCRSQCAMAIRAWEYEAESCAARESLRSQHVSVYCNSVSEFRSRTSC